jgi:two-component system CheB/CheR fusion protein
VPEKRKSRKDSPTVVGIGASAGGIEALQSLFTALPADLGHAYVVIMHLAPSHTSQLTAIVARTTSMTVREVSDGKRLRVKANHVYVIPPGQQLELKDASLVAFDLAESHGRRSTVDNFFKSLAEYRDGHFAIVLSGGGSDGLLGAKAIKEAGGIILAQDPEEAGHPDMPLAVISAGIADIVLPVRQLAARLAELTQAKRDLPDSDDADPDRVDDGSLNRILHLLNVRTGHDFSRYKRSTIIRRIRRRMQIRSTTGLDEYIAYVEANAKEVEVLLRDLLISVTMFFRDTNVWSTLSEMVIAPLVANGGSDETLRVWVPGCATGEEAYTVAMLFREQLLAQRLNRDLVVFASDVDEEALAVARAGRYPAAACADVSDERLQRFFRQEGDDYRVTGDLRDCVVFAVHSVLRDPPFSGLHLISCRNVMIYFSRELQFDVQKIFHYACRNDGFLLLGTSESADDDLFRPLHQPTRIYERKNLGSRNRRLLPDLVRTPAAATKRPRIAHRMGDIATSELHLQLLERHAPASVLIDEDHRVVHLSESAGRFLQHRGGQYDRTILELIRPELKEELRGALDVIPETHDNLMTTFVDVSFDGISRKVGLIVQPQVHQDDREDLILVLFLDGGPTEDRPGDDDKPDTNQLIATLREKLGHSQHRLDRAIRDKEESEQDLRAANEELQSLNEEYRSTTEELETSKEELQSVNEELQTVNSELKLKLDEISQAHNDLENLIASTNIATLFVDRDLNIKRITPRLAEIFNVQPADTERPIGDFTHKLFYNDLEQDARTVLESLTPIEKELETADGRVLVIRLGPYRTPEDRIEGVAITFVDVTTLTQTKKALTHSEKSLANELAMTRRLHQMTLAVATAESTARVFEEILATMVDICKADFGCFLLADQDSGELQLVEHRNVPPAYLRILRQTLADSRTIFATAAKSKKTVSISNISTSKRARPWFDLETRDTFSGVHVEPLIGDDNQLLGLLTVFFAQPRDLHKRHYQAMNLIAQHSSQLVLRRQQQDEHERLTQVLRRNAVALEANQKQLTAQAEDLRQQDQARQEFIRILGHELRNPLAAIVNSLDFLDLEFSSAPETDTGVHAFRVISRQSRHMQKLIDDLLDIGRITSGKYSLKMQTVDISQCIREVVNAIRPRFEARGVELNVSLTNHPLRVTADPERVVQILDNLLRNASSYTDSGGQVTVAAAESHGSVSISVLDTGIGMNPAKIEKLFEPYQQLEAERRDGGLGLGLMLVKQLVDLHGGSVTARSDGVGHGSEFIVHLPSADLTDDIEHVDSGTPGYKLAAYRILVVDDKPDNADALAAMLRQLGQVVETAYKGEQALQLLSGFSPQIAFLDISMPVMDGYELARRIREQYGDSCPPLVALTGHPQIREPELFDHLILKPISIAAVVELIHTSLMTRAAS